MTAIRERPFFKASLLSLLFHGLIIFSLTQAGFNLKIQTENPKCLPDVVHINLVQDRIGTIVNKTEIFPSKMQEKNPLEPIQQKTFSSPKSSELPASLKSVPAADIASSAVQTRITNSFVNSMDYRMLRLNFSTFSRISEAKLRDLIESAIPDSDWENMEGNEAKLTIRYTQNGDFESASIASGNDHLKQLLSTGVDYAQVPHPREYLLSYNELRFRIYVTSGHVAVLR
jgi:hypothetical protein